MGLLVAEDFISLSSPTPPAAKPGPEAEPAAVVEAPSTSGQRMLPRQRMLPWAQASKRIQSPLLRLHNGASCAAVVKLWGSSERQRRTTHSGARAEVVEFERFLAPMPQEAASRAAAVERIAAVVQAIWPAASVQVFGSFATGACAPLLSNGRL